MDFISSFFNIDNLQKYNLLMSSIIIVIFFFSSIFINKKENWTDTFKDTIGFMGGSYFMSSITTKPLSYFTKSVEPYVPTFLSTNKYSKIIGEYKIKYNKIQHKLTEHNNKIFLQRITELRNLAFNHEDDERFRTWCSIIDYMLVLEGETESRADIQKDINNIEEYLKTVQPDTSENIKDKFFKPYLSNVYNTDKYIPIAPLFLVGSPGTGKTTFVHKIGDILNIPIHESEKTPQIMSCREIRFYDKFEHDMMNIYTELAYRAKMCKSDSVILFIDELDKKINSDKDIIINLLEILNNSGKCIKNLKDSYLNYEVCVKNIIIICCGNVNIKNIEYKNRCEINLDALSSRFLTINFVDIDKKGKRYIVEQFINKNYSYFSLKKYSTEINDLIKNDTEPGIRVLLINLILLINKHTCNEIFNNTSWSDNQ
jgi:ATP-dependent Lon protease